MKFDYCLGNPPYQETKGSTRNVNIWPDFIKETSKISNMQCLIHPGRWVIPKENDKKLQKELIEDYKLKQLKYYPNSGVCFPGIALDGGVSITLFDSNFKGTPTIYIENKFYGKYNIGELLFTTPFFEEAYKKVFANIDPDKNMQKYKFGASGFNSFNL